MSRFGLNDADHYGNNGGSSFFSIANDHEVKKVRFLYNNPEDVEGYALHEVTIDGKKRYVNCLREYNSPIDDCPFCKAHQNQIAKLFIPVWNVEEEKVQYWERGKSMLQTLSGHFVRIPSSVPIVSQMFEIERHGAKGDKKTEYQIFPVGQPDNTTLNSLCPDGVPSPVGNVILDKTPREMDYYLQNGVFPEVGGQAQQAAPQQTYARRTPATNNVDRF